MTRRAFPYVMTALACLTISMMLIAAMAARMALVAAETLAHVAINFGGTL